MEGWIIVNVEFDEVYDPEIYRSYEEAKSSEYADLDNAMIIKIGTFN